MTQIPIFRAKNKYNNEYLIGYLTESKSGIDLEFTNFMILPFLNLKEHEVVQTDYEPIDPSTLAIHFPDMLDSQGNKIFASLSEDGKGGDICSPDGIEVYFYIQDGCTFLKNDEWEKEISRVAYNNFKVIGIQQ